MSLTPQPPDVGEPLDEDLLMQLAEIDEDDIERALRWFDRHASPEWRGALDTEVVEDADAG